MGLGFIGYASLGPGQENNFSPEQGQNVVVSPHQMPVDGWLTGAEVFAGGQTAYVHGNIALWWGSDRGNALFYQSPRQVWQPGPYLHGLPLRRL